MIASGELPLGPDVPESVSEASADLTASLQLLDTSADSSESIAPPP